jgi:hypothetical protein
MTASSVGVREQSTEPTADHAREGAAFVDTKGKRARDSLSMAMMCDDSGDRSLLAATLAAILGLVLGGLVGFAAGRGTQAPEESAPRRSPTTPEQAPTTTLTGPLEGRSPVPEPHLDPACRNRPSPAGVVSPPVQGPSGPGRRTPDEAREEAGQVFEDFLRLFQGKTEDTDDLMRIAGRLGMIDRDLAFHFAERYRAAALPQGDPKARETALFLAVLAGGDEASRLLEEILTRPERYPEDHRSILQRVGRPGDLVWSLDRATPTPRTVSLAFTLLESGMPADRRAGAGILRGVPTPEAMDALERILEFDSDLEVRLTAASSLGEIGDGRTLLLFERVLASLSDADGRLQEACRKSMSRIRRRLP